MTTEEQLSQLHNTEYHFSSKLDSLICLERGDQVIHFEQWTVPILLDYHLNNNQAVYNSCMNKTIFALSRTARELEKSSFRDLDKTKNTRDS